MDRIEGFDVARGAAVVMVVVLHATMMPQCCLSLSQPVSRMGLLMLISGVVAAPARERGWHYSRNRSLDLLWLYVLWTPILALAQWGTAGVRLIPAELVAPSGPLWYLAALALLCASVPLLRRVPPAVPLALTMAADLWRVAGHQTGITGFDQPARYAMFFYAGLYGRPWVVALLTRCGARVGALAALAALVLPILPLQHGLAMTVEAAAVLLVAQMVSGAAVGPVLAGFGRHTADVYLAHWPLLMLAKRLVGSFGAPGLVLLTIGIVAASLALRTCADRAGLSWLYRRPRIALLDRVRWQPGTAATGHA